MSNAVDSSPKSLNAPVAKATAPPSRAAYFDVDGTITATNIVMPLYWYKSRLSGAPAAMLWKLSLAVRGPYWFILDRIDRAASNRAIYSNYGGMDSAAVKRMADDCYADCLKRWIMPKAMQRVVALKNENVKIVLVTGGLDLIMRPLAQELGADCIAPGLAESNGRFNGTLASGAISGVRKAEAVKEHAREHGIDLSQSFAFGDSFEGDFPMLETVGHPSAVNPDRRLARIAAQRGWTIERWKK